MVVIKYSKLDEGMFLSQQNIKNIFKNIFNISGINVNMSELTFLTTIGGIQSCCEYIFINLPSVDKNVEAKIINVVPDWLKIEYIYNLENLNLKTAQFNALYAIQIDEFENYRKEIIKFIQSDLKFLEKFNFDSCEVEADNINLITSIDDDQEQIVRFVRLLNKHFNTELFYTIEKIEQYFTYPEINAKNIDNIIKALKKTS